MSQDLALEKSRAELCGQYLIESLIHKGCRWPYLKHTGSGHIDAAVCSYLGSVIPDLDAKVAFEVYGYYEDNTLAAEARYDRQRVQKAANKGASPVDQVFDSIAVANRFMQLMEKDPSKSGVELLADAAAAIHPDDKVRYASLPGAIASKATRSGDDANGKKSKAKKKNDARKRAKVKEQEQEGDTK